MASPFQKYTSGIEASTGNLVSAYGQMAQQTQNAFAGLGKSLAEGIEGYTENKNKREITAAKGAGLYENIKFLQSNIADNPELGQFAERFKPIMDKFSKFESMSTNQQTAFLLEAEAFQQQVVPNLTIYEKGLIARTKQGVNAALSTEVKIPDNQGGYVKGTPFSTADTIEDNLALARKSFEVQAKTNGLTNFNIDSALSKLAGQWENSFANDPNLAKNDPKLRDAILKNISDWRNQSKISGEIAGQSSEDYGTGENIMGQVGALAEAQKNAGVSAAQALNEQDTAATLAAQKKAGVAPAAGVTENKPLLTATQKAVEAGKPIWAELNKAKADLEKADDRITRDFTYTNGEYVDKTGKAGGYVEAKEKRDALREKVGTLTNKYNSISVSDFKDDVAPPTPVDTRSIEQILAERKVKEVKPKTAEDAVINNFAKSVIANTQKTLENTIRTGGNITVGDIARDINSFELKNNPTLTEKYTTFGAGGGYGVVKAPTRVSDAQTDVTKAAAKLGIPTDKPMTADQMYKLSKELENQSVLTGTKATKAAKTLEELTPETVGLGIEGTQAPAVNKYAKTFDYGANIQEGVKEGTRPETYAEEKERVRQWFVTNNKGIIPSSLDEVYRGIRPETDVRFMPAPDGGQVMITHKGAQYIPPVKTTAMSDKAKSEVTLYNWGTKTANGYIPEERTKGSGIKLAGFALGGEDNAKAFQQLHNDTVKIRTIVPQLLAMYQTDKLGRTLIPNADWGIAKSLLAQLKAAIRVETVGTGPVAIAEHASIEKRVADPTAFFALDITGKATLEGLLKSNEMALKNNNAGIQVSFDPPASVKKNSIQQARLEAAGVKK